PGATPEPGAGVASRKRSGGSRSDRSRSFPERFARRERSSLFSRRGSPAPPSRRMRPGVRRPLPAPPGRRGSPPRPVRSEARLTGAVKAEPGRLLTVAEVGEIIRAKAPKVRALARSRALASVRVGKSVLFKPGDVAEFIERNRFEAIDRDR